MGDALQLTDGIWMLGWIDGDDMGTSIFLSCDGQLWSRQGPRWWVSLDTEAPRDTVKTLLASRKTAEYGYALALCPAKA